MFEGPCFLKTRNGGFKEYTIVLDKDEVRLVRPGSSKCSEIEYSLSNVQCMIQQRNKVDEAAAYCRAGVTCSGEHCLTLSFSESHKRAVFFASEQALKLWH